MKRTIIKKRKDYNKGITLIALIITIIVLLILASISVVALVGDNGIILMAKKASDEVDNSERKDQEDLENLIAEMNRNRNRNENGSTDSKIMIQKDIKDTKDILINPGKGLVLYGASHISSEQYIVPKFVFEKGANFDTAVNENGVLQYIPDWQDPTFLEYLNKFVKALGDHFNGNKNIAYIDIRSYGNFGEQHLFGLKVDDNYSWKKKIDSTFLKEKYIKPYMDAFPDTLLINPWGDDDYNDTYEEVLNQGVSLRRDGIVEYDNGLDFLAKAYGKLPVIFEYAGNYKDYIKNGTEDYFNERLEDAIAISKPSYVELDMDWYNNNKSYCEDLANRIGYYFRFKKAVYYQEEKVNTPTDILSFKNDGIAPIYEDCSVYVGLLNQSNKLVQKYKVDINPKEWQPGKHVNKKISINFNNVNSGNYKLAVGLYKKDEDKKTTYLIVI